MTSHQSFRAVGPNRGSDSKQTKSVALASVPQTSGYSPENSEAFFRRVSLGFTDTAHQAISDPWI
jgi:hypothetical protein